MKVNTDQSRDVRERSSISARLSVVFYIILCIEIGIFLTVLPWWPQGMWGISDWGNNYFLLYAARRTGIQQIQTVVASGWVRGAVTGIGLLNFAIAFWEIFHFKQTVRALQNQTVSSNTPGHDNPRSATANPLPDHERNDDRPDNS